jgi:hypothetical protein
MQPKKRTRHQTKMQDSFSLNSTKIHIITEVTVLSPSFNEKLKIKFMAHFYSRKYEMKLESGKDPNPLGSYIWSQPKG